MEPVTHFMTGACLGRAGFNRTTAYATVAMTLAAEAPDLDVFWSVAGPIAAFQHHRGWTHTLIGTPVVATAVVLVIFAFDRWRRQRSMNAKAALPVRWGMLWLCAWIAALSHILLDFTNNYGVRPFFPFNPHWYAGGIVFIFEPVLFVVLLLALVVPALLGLTDREIGARGPVFRGRKWASFALIVMVSLWSWRYLEQQSAKRMVLNDEAAQDGGPVQVKKVALSPYPVNPYMWQAVVETPDYYRVATVNVRNGSVVSDAQTDIFYKPAETPATLAAKQSRLGRAYLDWSHFPLVREEGNGVTENGETATVVTFHDLRFHYDNALFGRLSKNPLGASAYVNASNQVVQMQMGESIQR
ncbi:MAG TPA: metal-dependent hydrolase [Acidobacteriaceae bacterium]